MLLIFWVGKETDVSGLSLFYFCYRRNLYGRVSYNFTVEMLCNSFRCYFHKYYSLYNKAKIIIICEIICF